MAKYEPLKGNVYGRLTVIEDIRDETVKKGSKHKCKCICSCDGKEIIIPAAYLTRNEKKSCGCIRLENITKHGMSHDRFYNIYNHIIDRCNNKNNDRYLQYGARGIKCLWTSFEEFKNDMYESYQKHFETHNGDTTIDRIDVNGNYCKENCRWLTNKEQQSNKQNSHKVNDGSNEVLSYKAYCKKYNISYSRVQYRMKKYNYTFEQAVQEVLENAKIR